MPLSSAVNYPVEVDMNRSHAVCAAIAVACLAACAGYENVDAKLDAEAAPEAVPDVAPQPDPEQYRISVEIPVDDVTIERGENLDVDALLDERTSFTASDFHLREVVLIARSRRGGSAELLLDEWASGAVDIPEGAAESWYEVRIPAADVGEAGIDWVLDFTGALDLNLLVAILEPRSGLIAQAEATVREVALEDEIQAAPPTAAAAAGSGEVVHGVEVVETAPQVVVNEVAVVEQPVYRTRTVYRYVDRPVYSYRVSWIYDPARYYVFRDYGGWTYRYFPGTWDWRCYNLSFRLPSHHHHRDRNRHRADRHDGRRYERRDRDDRRGDRDRRRNGRDRDMRDRRDGGDRDRGRRGVRPRGNETPAVVSRPRALRRQVDSGHPRIQLATQRRAEPRVEEGRRTNPRRRAFQGTGELPNYGRTNTPARVERPTNPRLGTFERRDSGIVTSPSRNVAPPTRVEGATTRRLSTDDHSPADRNARIRSFERREPRREEPRATVTATPGRVAQSPADANRTETSEPRRDGLDVRSRTFERAPQQRTPSRSVSRRTTIQQRPAVREDGARPREDALRSNPRTRVFQRQADPRAAAPTMPGSVQPRSREFRRTVPSTADRPRSAVRERGNVRTRAFQRHAEQRVEPQRTQPRVQRRPRSTPPVHTSPPRQVSNPPARTQRVAPSRNAPQRERPVQRAPVKPQQSDSTSDARPGDGKPSNSRRRAFERR